MGIVFNADEIIEMAEQLERNGAKFYRDAADSVTDPQDKKMLLELSEMEVRHGEMFKQMRASLKADEEEATVFDPNQEAVGYLRSLADSRVFFEKTIDLTSKEEILKAAIQAEKDSIVFYLGMREIVPEALGKKRTDDIMREEMGHIQILSKELMALNGK